MAYLLYSLVFLTIISGTVLYLTRLRWLPILQDTIDNVHERWPRAGGFLYSALPTSNSFAGDVEAGLSSSNFDLAGNIEGGDSRGGLDNIAKKEILKIMNRRKVKFDEARRIYMEQRFSANGIGADGRPKDPKFVSFS
ncbi:Fungal protein of unknown function (DUF2015) domain containing protein [Naviculisporaceae sp. PSN 640]